MALTHCIYLHAYHLNKLVSKNLVDGMPKLKLFESDKI